MDSNIDNNELEQEQLDYLRRNYDKTMHVPNTDDMNIDPLVKPLDDRIMLTPEQEKKLVQEVLKHQQIQEESVKKKKVPSFSLSTYFDILVESFVDIMDDIVNFDGDIENATSIFTKGDRLVLAGTIIFVFCLFYISMNKSS